MGGSERSAGCLQGLTPQALEALVPLNPSTLNRQPKPLSHGIPLRLRARGFEDDVGSTEQGLGRWVVFL